MPTFPVTERSLETIRKTMEKQDKFGLDKYGKALDYKDNYSWLNMAVEELADSLKYIQCEMDRKKEVIHVLKMGLRSDVPREFIELALEILTVEGTGK